MLVDPHLDEIIVMGRTLEYQSLCRLKYLIWVGEECGLGEESGKLLQETSMIEGCDEDFKCYGAKQSNRWF